MCAPTTEQADWNAPDAASPTPRIAVVARQPIFDSQLRVVAYELLYRTPGATRAAITDPALATAQVLVSAALDIGMRHLVGDHVAYINFPAGLIASGFRPPLSPEQIVIEVLEDCQPDDALLASLRQLRDQGYLVALDDYDIRTASPLLLEQADIVKVDVREHSAAELAASVQSLRQHAVRLVAEKIETREELRHCKALGFDLFQGFFLQKPQILQASKAPGASPSVLRLVVELSNPNLVVDDIEKSICADVGLSYRILRCINSSYFGMPREVCSIREAILLLGFAELHKLCWLMLLAGLDGKPAHLCVQSLQRARTCEALCEAAGLPDRDAYFMAGMLSILDALLDQPLTEALSSLPLPADVRAALTHRAGVLGEALDCMDCYERGDWPALRFLALSPDEIAQCYIRSTEWADRTWSRFRPDG